MMTEQTVLGRQVNETNHRFESLLAPHAEVMAGYVHRLVGHPVDAEDLVQDIKLKAFERLSTLRSDEAFRGWLFTIATRTCLDHLRRQKRWRPYSQSYIEQECDEDASRRQQVIDATKDPEHSFDVREHIAFCFTCVGRSLPPIEAAALLLREVLGFTNREAAKILDLTESVLRRHLSSARTSMEAAFEGLCSLVNKEGICRQCSSFRSVMSDGKKGPALPVLDDRTEAWPRRLAVVRDSHFAGGVSTPLHDVLFQLIKNLESSQPD